jgi:hypothetical protein
MAAIIVSQQGLATDRGGSRPDGQGIRCRGGAGTVSVFGSEFRP